MAGDDPGAAFKMIGGKLCLDFINTVSARRPNPRAGGRDYADRIEKERLVAFDDLVRWGRATGTVSAAEAKALARAARGAPAKAALVVARARTVREALYRVFVALLHRWRPEAADVEVLNREVLRARVRERLTPEGRGFGWTWDADSGALDRVLWPVMRSAADLMLSKDLDRVRRCAGEECRWMFFDATRNRNRRWCDMADCGNIDKVRRFRRRQ